MLWPIPEHVFRNILELEMLGVSVSVALREPGEVNVEITGLRGGYSVLGVAERCRECAVRVSSVVDCGTAAMRWRHDAGVGLRV